MPLQSHLENLRTKPAHIRTRIAFWSSFGITAVIFAFWLGSFSTFGISGSPSAAVAEGAEQAGSPSQTLVASVGTLYTDIKDAFFGPKKIVYSTVEVMPGK